MQAAAAQDSEAAADVAHAAAVAQLGAAHEAAMQESRSAAAVLQAEVRFPSEMRLGWFIPNFGRILREIAR